MDSTSLLVEKRCSKCREPGTFGRDRRAADGLQSQCRLCCRKGDARRYPNEATARRAYQAEYWAALSPDERSRRNRAAYLKFYHGLSVEAYDELLERQRGLCALCSEPPRATGRHTRLQVDHCHKTGRIRGLLCNECNTALGRLGDDADGLRRALKYLDP